MMKTTKFGTLFLISIMALAGVTAGYAIWQETLTISGTVGTGSFDVEWTILSFGDDETEDKNVSDITATVDGFTMTVTITGAYPCITYYVIFQIKSTGTVPAHFTAWQYGSGTGTALPASATVLVAPEATYPAITEEQLHQGDIWKGKLTVHLDNPGTEEGATYTFTVSTIAHQYNEEPT